MTNRQQHIEAGALAEYGSECRAMHHFTKGAEWADEHPSEQTLTKTVYLYKRWFYNDSGLNVMEFIKKNWNIEI